MTYAQKEMLERLRRQNQWWYSMNSFAAWAGYSMHSTRLMLDTLCLAGKVEKLIDKEGEGYYLKEED